MKAFGIITLVLSVLASSFGLLGLIFSGGNTSDLTIGACLLGIGSPGMLLSCVVITLADIRTSLQSAPVAA
jgi:hypothetical protein